MCVSIDEFCVFFRDRQREVRAADELTRRDVLLKAHADAPGLAEPVQREVFVATAVPAPGHEHVFER